MNVCTYVNIVILMIQTLLSEYFFFCCSCLEEMLLKKKSFMSKRLCMLRFKHKIIVFEQVCVLLQKDEEAKLILLLDSLKHHSVRM